MPNYYSIQAPITNEIIINKSRFLTYLYPIQTEAEFNRYYDDLRKEHRKANHLCYAFVLGNESQIQRMSDDGEPTGTAGIPMLEVLKQKELTFIMAVTVRYFGGIKLGSGGLIRAYSQSVSDGLAQSQLVANEQQVIVHLTIDYPDFDRLQHQIAKQNLPLTILHIEYLSQIIIHLAILAEDEAQIRAELTDYLNGKLLWEFQREEAINLPISQ